MGTMQATIHNPTEPQHPNSHYQPLVDAIPQWLGKATSTRRQALKSTAPRLTERLKAASTAQHQTLKQLNEAHLTLQNDVDQRLAHLHDADAFAEPLLKRALKDRFDLDLDVRATCLRLYIPVTVAGWINTGDRSWTVSLLEAALHNFDMNEAQDDAYEADSSFITKPSATGQFDTLPNISEKLSIPAFIKLCRELDIGAQYKTYLEDNLGISNPVVAAVLQPKVEQSQKAALKSALQLARMNGDISEDYFRMVSGLADGVHGIRVDGQALRAQNLRMLSTDLTGIVLFAPDLYQANDPVRVVAYVPDDPEHPIKEYASTIDMAMELTRQLRADAYQRFFSRFVNHENRGTFFGTLKTRLSHMTWHQPEAGSSLPVWRETPIDDPELHVNTSLIAGDMWEHLYQGKLNKILNDARSIAVPTEAADQKARWAFWDSIVKIASKIIETVTFVIAPFVPGLGEVMMAYMAYQLLDEAFTGIIDWAQGRTTEAFEQLMAVVESLIQLGTFAVGGAIAAGEWRNVLPKDVVAFIDTFKPVTLPQGQTRYWDQDLNAYQQKTTPPVGSKANRLGLHQRDGQQLLRLEQAHYAVSKSATPGVYQIEHPTRPEAYKPALRHNGDGAWYSELDQPLEWDAATALQRIGHRVEDFTPARREQMLKVSGSSENALRKMHVERETLPPLLADSIKRFKIDQDLQLFIDQLDSELPEQYLRADASTQFQLLTEHGRWPAGKRLRLLDEAGQTTWQSSSDETLPLTDIHQDRLNNTDPLVTLLSSLDEQVAKALLGEEFGAPQLAADVRARNLRKQLVGIAKAQRSALFEARYKASEQNPDPLAQTIARQQPQLPDSVTRELLDTATGAELEAISQGTLPERQQQLLDLANQETRVTRAFEGLELGSVSNPDSDTLALHSLQRLPGWTRNVCLEVRNGHYEGPILDSTGRADAPEQKVLVRQPDGTYRPYDNRGQELHSATDLYSALLYALPDAERQGLGIHIGQGERLKAALRAHSLPRSELRLAFSQLPVEGRTTDALRLLGIEGYPRATPIGGERGYIARARIQTLYPTLSAPEINNMILTMDHQPLGLMGEIARLQAEYEVLTAHLSAWADDVPAIDAASNLPLTEIQRRSAKNNRQLLKTQLERCWRLETRSRNGSSLNVTEPVMGELPTLTADFDHVTQLSISGSQSTRAVQPFLARFPELRHLDMGNLELRSVPPAIETMTELRRLVLPNCAIELTPEGNALLSSLDRLNVLILRNNPLGIPPDTQAMPELEYLDLSNTNISTVPDNLPNNPQLKTANMSNNQITELPEALFALTSEASKKFNFSNNPLSTAARERVKAHYDRTRQNFGVMADQADLDRTRALYPDLNPEQANALIYSLPGTLADGSAQLGGWETEITQMSDVLRDWARDVPDVHPVTGQPQNNAQMYAEYVAREEFAQNLERFWRRRSSQDPTQRADRFESKVASVGDLPVLTADFSHVTGLELKGNSAVGTTEQFLRLFPNLRDLQMRNFALHQIPPVLSVPPLERLVLSDCGITLSPQSRALLSSYPQLSTLDLSDNPLGLPLDLAALPQLTYVDLANTGLSEVPAGLLNHPRLKEVFLNDNQITELPEALFDLPEESTKGFSFGNNPLSSATRERIKAYYQRTKQYFGVFVEQADLNQTQALYSNLDREQASEFFYSLPGTLADSRTELTRRETELTNLTNDLTAWSSDIPEHSTAGTPLTAEERLEQQTRRMSLKEHLLDCWRKQAEVRTVDDEYGFSWSGSIIGDLPVTNARFNHVSMLELRNSENSAANASQFLEHFPAVRDLHIQNHELGSIPEIVFQMPLKLLSLQECRITLTESTLDHLAGMTHLEYLNLRGNPLGLTPDCSRMQALIHADLSNTGISEIPAGLLSNDNIDDLDLSNNAITEMPAAIMDVDPDRTLNFRDNPFTQASLERITRFYRRTGNDLGLEGLDDMPALEDELSDD
ncbi:dermonecrotic toxin domain-containing protein [Pseudomonas vancouverensis]|uniref:dermonecrotic toxin domain-containing protein n=1 Tax=Pseudomonas vancouverensis TaxID=95300 RepID=UPI003D05CBB2